MNRIDYTNVKKSRNIMLIFFIIGMLFLIIMGFAFLRGPIKKTFMDSKVVAISKDSGYHISYDDEDGETAMYKPIYTYEVNGNTYKCETLMSSSKSPSKDDQYVYYDSANPSNCITDYEAKLEPLFFIVLLLPLIFIVLGLTQTRKYNKRIKKLKILETTGVLIKGLPYTMESTGLSVNDREILAPAVDYTLPTGEIIHLKGDGRHDHKYSDEDNLVDLLIDPADPTNYYIDFNIN